MGLVVELVGPPGCGKTTLGAMTSKDTGWPFVGGRKEVQAAFKVLAVASRPRLAAAVFWGTTKGLQRRKQLMVSVSKRDRLIEKMRRSSERVVLMEGGAIMRLCLEAANGGVAPHSVVKRLSCPDLLCLLKAEEDTLQGRLKERPPVGSDGVPQMTKASREWIASFQSAMMTAAASMDCAKVTIRTDRDLDSAVRELDETVGRLKGAEKGGEAG